MCIAPDGSGDPAPEAMVIEALPNLHVAFFVGISPTSEPTPTCDLKVRCRLVKNA